jgi:glycopeptide antibiotics resistance protein
MRGNPLNRAYLGPISLVYLAFVIYGSLVPLDFQPRPLAETLNAFSNIRWLNLGVASRADWVANLLLYMPLGFLGSAWLTTSGQRTSARLAAALFALPFCMALAIGIEFVQLYFPGRTVSLNDLLAETLGSMIGVGLFVALGDRVIQIWQRWLEGGQHAIGAFAMAYLAAYLALSLFPFDFLVSQAELSQKWSSDTVSWLVAKSGCDKPVLCLVRLIVEMLLVAPLGAFVAHQRHGRRGGLLLAAVFGAFLGVALELVQAFIASSLVQGVSVLTRGTGMAAGFLLYRHFRHGSARAAPGWVLLLAVAFWLLLVIWLNGWLTHDWLNREQGFARLDEVRFLPFYYHYYTTETQALTSLLSVAGMYAPLGVWFWLWLPTRPKAVGLAALTAVVLCSVMESGRLFLSVGHPDPSNLFIAGLAAGAAARLLEVGRRWSVRHLIMPVNESASDVTRLEAMQRAEFSRPAQIVALAMLIGAGVALVTYPLSATVLGTGLAVYAWVLWRNPSRWLFWLPALLPVLNLAPVSGRIMFDELDALLMVTVAILYLRLPVGRRSAAAWTPFLLLAASAAVSLVIGLWSPPPLDANTFANYQSSFNALRVGKGFLWALLLAFWIRRSGLSMQRMANRFAYGMTLGLLFTASWVIWERSVYPGLFNFEEDFRVTGPFVEMHTGGGAIEAYLVAAMPFAFLLWRRAPSSLVRLLAGLTMILAGYALGVTYARAGYLGMLASVMVLLLGLGWRVVAQLWRGRSALPLSLLVALVGIISVLPLFLGDYMPARFANTARDAVTRTDHWRDSLELMQPREWLFGVGLGRYPGAYYWRNLEASTPANYAFQQDAKNTWLRLLPGEPLYFEQIVDIQPGRAYRLELNVRGTIVGDLGVLICEKAMLYSTRCVTLKFPITPDWTSKRIEFDSGQVGEGNWFERRVVKLALHAGGGSGYVEVDNVRLEDLGGHELLRNGNFRSGMDYWNFATDRHLAWHAKNLLLHIHFEQGLVGLAAWSLLIATVVVRLFRQTRQGDMAALALLSSVLGMLVVGLFDSVLDVPRLNFLLLMMMTMALAHESRQRHDGKTRKLDAWSL